MPPIGGGQAETSTKGTRVDVRPGTSNAEHAYALIRERLVMLDIRPSEPINDEALARQLGFGRTPVREALKQLERDRLVIAYPRRGTFATTVDITDLAYISEIRTQLEPVAAARAARTASRETRQVLTGLADEIAGLDPDEDPRSLLRKDVNVHTEIYRACGNPHLEDVLVCQDAHATRIWCLFLDRLPHIAGHIIEHTALLRAIVDGDAELAAKLALEHVVGFEQAVRAVI
jgi:DNA-binding GntR family transcriptional regulator